MNELIIKVNIIISQLTRLVFKQKYLRNNIYRNEIKN